MVSQTGTSWSNNKEPNLSWKRAKELNEIFGASKCYLGPNFWNLAAAGPNRQPCAKAYRKSKISMFIATEIQKKYRPQTEDYINYQSWAWTGSRMDIPSDTCDFLG